MLQWQVQQGREYLWQGLLVFHLMTKFYPFYVASDSGLEGEGAL